MGEGIRIKSKITGFTLVELLVVLAIVGVLCGLMFKGYFYVLDKQAHKQAYVELRVLKVSIENYRRSFNGYPICPQNVCTPGECLFLSLAGFHNEKGTLEMPPYPATISTELFGYDLESYDTTQIPDIEHNEGKSLMLWLSQILGKDVAFKDPWGNDYVYEYPLQEGGRGFRLFSMGPDGKTGEDEWIEDDLE
ncbi:type II secretion system protein GspG [Opitutales bacterium]|uniref:type II secretion system protein GspG n=1 Tax=Candidatus Seribacter sulfatis TaxID=3381756 RepID=UPI00230DCD1D|nr:type II secretion system protein GspG [Opitutales bacterium]